MILLVLHGFTTALHAKYDDFYFSLSDFGNRRGRYFTEFCSLILSI